MSAAEAGPRVLARIRSDLFWVRTEAYRDEVRAWLRANGVDPNLVPTSRDVEVVMLDGPAIVREEKVLSEDGNWRTVPGTRRAAVRTVHSLCRVPLPEHLGDPL